MFVLNLAFYEPDTAKESIHPELITVGDLLVVEELLAQLSELQYYYKRDEIVFTETPANDTIKIFTYGWMDISR